MRLPQRQTRRRYVVKIWACLLVYNDVVIDKDDVAQNPNMSGRLGQCSSGNQQLANNSHVTWQSSKRGVQRNSMYDWKEDQDTFLGSWVVGRNPNSWTDSTGILWDETHSTRLVLKDGWVLGVLCSKELYFTGLGGGASAPSLKVNDL